jgi:hypothetical protein
MKFRKKTVIIEAEQFNSYERPLPFQQFSVVCFTPDQGFFIPTLEGDMRLTDGDWVIRGIQGEFYPCKPDIFEATYDVVEEA